MNKKMLALLSIVENGKGKKLIKTLKNQEIWVNFQMIGQGTAPTEMLDIFGLGTNDKDIILSVGAQRVIRELMDNIEDTVQSSATYGGIMVVLDVAATGRLFNELLHFGDNQNEEREVVAMPNEHHNHLIVISVNEGFGEEVMQVARKAGATGGTVIKGRLADVDRFAEFVESKAEGEREMLLILAPAKGSKQIMEEVNREFGIASEANGILFALPTEQAFKI